MRMPSLSIREIEDMQIKEIESRINYFNKTNRDIKSVELKGFMSLIHLAISTGSNPSKKNQRLFYKQLDKIFNKKDPVEDNDQSLEDIMGLVNVKK